MTNDEVRMTSQTRRKAFRTPYLVVLVLLASAAPAQMVHVWIPDSIRVHRVGDTVDVPVLIANHVGRGVVAVDMALEFGDDSLAGMDSSRTGNAVPNGWMVFANSFPCSVLVAMAGANQLVAGETLVLLPMVTRSSVAQVRIARCILNEGQVPCSTSNGTVSMQEGRAPFTSRCLPLAISPNPASEAVWLACAEPVALVSATGRAGLLLRPGLNNVSLLPRGVYFVRQRQPGCSEQKVILTR